MAGPRRWMGMVAALAGGGCAASEDVPPAPSEPVGAPRERTLPMLELSASSLDAFPGHTLAIHLRADDPPSLSLRFLDQERTAWAQADGTWRVLIGVPLRTPPGPHELVVEAEDGKGHFHDHSVTIEVHEVDWPFTGRLPLSRSRTTPAGIARMRAERDTVYAAHSPEQEWDGAFILPVAQGVHTSAYGSYREYPDGSRSFHDAEDIARKRGVPVVAAADGVVALAREQEIHGNAVLLDHGQGVVGLYSHLDRIDVVEGQRVVQGEGLGAMGSTGRTTGPHLHWGLVVDGVAVDPMEWVMGSPETGSASAWLPLVPGAQ